MRTLVYKRTHTGDPSEEGVFGCNGCMGRVRAWPFEAVIGVGGVGASAEKHGIAYKLTWIGVGPHRIEVEERPDPVVVFDHFRLFDQNGKDFRDVAPVLADRIFTHHVRTAMTFSEVEAAEIKRLLSPAAKWLPSPVLVTATVGAKSACKKQPKCSVASRSKSGCRSVPVRSDLADDEEQLTIIRSISRRNAICLANA